MGDMKPRDSVFAELELARAEKKDATDPEEEARLEGQIAAFEWVLGL